MVNRHMFKHKINTNILKGFARSSYWEYLGIITDNNNEVSVRLGLMDTQLPSEVRKVWPHSFRLVYTVILTEKSLKTFCNLKNEGEDTFEFNILLHTYFRVPVSNIHIQIT
jgi:D-hexose-6-phosphate mutarotase